jgi:hypothetical protein
MEVELRTGAESLTRNDQSRTNLHHVAVYAGRSTESRVEVKHRHICRPDIRQLTGLKYSIVNS